MGCLREGGCPEDGKLLSEWGADDLQTLPPHTTDGPGTEGPAGLGFQE